MGVNKRKRETVDSTEDLCIESEGSSIRPIAKKEKLSGEALKTVGTPPSHGLVNGVHKQSNGTATPAKKKVRLGQKLRKKVNKANEEANKGQLLIKPLSKGEQLRSLIRKRKQESGVQAPDVKEKPYAVERQVDKDENYLELSENTLEKVPIADDVIDSEEEDVAESAPLPPFNARSFRKTLAGKDRMPAFRNFVKLLLRPRDTDVATEYMTSGGSALEILQVLDPSDRDNFGHANPVFNALHNIIMRSLTDSPAFKPSCEEGCRHLLNAYLPTIQRMLSEKASGRERKTVLQLLTGVVSMSSIFARDLLTNLNFPMPILKLLTLTVRSGEKQNVRRYFIHYLMAYLVDKNVALIRPLLDKPGLLNSIVFGLGHDSSETVQLVLGTLRTSVAENRAISKTHKCHVFNTNIVKALVRLYDWTGPRAYRKNKHMKDVWAAEQTVDSEGKAAVTASLDALLTILCTNHKLGVVFVDKSLGTSNQPLNLLMWSVLKDLQRPWETPHIRDLVVRILAACPDLIKGRMTEVEAFIQPRLSVGWMQTVGYVQQVVQAMDPDACLAAHARHLGAHQLARAVQTLCAPLSVTRAMNRAMLLHESLAVRHEALRLLRAMLRQACAYFQALERWGVLETVAARDRFRAKITRNFPSVTLLLEAWDLAFIPAATEDTSPTSSLSPPTLPSHISLLLDLLLLYHKVGPDRFKSDVGPDRSKADVGPDQSKSDVGPHQSKSDVGHDQSKSDVVSDHVKSDVGLDQAKSGEGPDRSKLDVGPDRPKSDVGPDHSKWDVGPDRFNSDVGNLSLHKLLADIKALGERDGSAVQSLAEKERDNAMAEGAGESAELPADAEREGESVDEIQVKAVRLVLAVDSSAFKDNKEIFSESLNLLLRLFRHPSPAISVSAYSVLTSVMTATGLFARSPGEVDVWLHSYRALPSEQQDSAGQLFVSSLRKVMRRPEKYSAAVRDAEGKVRADTKGSGNDAVASEVTGDSATYLSPFLPCIVSNIQEDDSKSTKTFLNFALIHLLHSQTYPSTILHLVDEKYMDLKVAQYVRSWLDKKTKNISIPFGALFGADSVEHKLSVWILTSNESSDVASRVKIEPTDEKPPKSKLPCIATGDVKVDDVIGLDNDPIHLSLLFNLTMFHLTRLVARHQLKEKSWMKCTDALKMLLEKQNSLSQGSVDGIHESYPRLCFRNLFQHPVLLKFFTPFNLNKNVVHSIATDVIVDLVRWASVQFQGDTKLRTLLQPYKDKLVICMVNDLKTSRKKDYEDNKHLLDIVGTFDLEFTDICIVLKELVAFPAQIFMEKSNNLSSWGLLLAYFLRRVTALRKENRSLCGALPSEVVSSTAERLSQLLANKDLDLAVLLESFNEYLRQFPHNVADMPTGLFISIMKTAQPSEASVNLGTYILSQNWKKMKPLFIEYATKSKAVMVKSEIIFPFLSVLVDNKLPISQQFLELVYNCYEDNIILGIRKPKKAAPWLASNVLLLTRLIEKCMSDETCKELCANIQAKHSMCSNQHIQLIESVFLKASKSHTDGVNPLVTLTTVFLNLLTQAVSKDKSVVNPLCTLICKYVERDLETSAWESVKSSADWLPFTMQALKLGLHAPQAEYGSALLLQTLTHLCRVLYKDDGNDDAIATLFQMAMSHSEFLNVMLGATTAKLELLKLLTTLIAKNPSVMSTSHVPVLLGSYTATLSLADQLTLKLLKTYELGGVSLHECRPYLWGEAAVNFFCVKSKEAQALWRQPQMGQVVDLLKRDMVDETITRFPVDRKLNLDPYPDSPHLYDPAFLLPLFSHLLASESFVKCYKFTHTGCLALVLSSLASASVSIRAAAYHVLARFHGHLDASRETQDKKWWLQFFDAVKNGVVELGEGEAAPRLACIVATFLARTSLVISQPLDHMFAPLNRFILAKSAMNLDCIPELYILFHSTEVDSRLYRRWLLEVIRDGLRTKLDWALCLNQVLFKLLFVFYSSVIATQDKRSKVLILQIVSSAMKLPGVAQLLVTSYGLLSWLHQVVRQLTSSDGDLVNATIQILDSLWHAITDAARPKVVHSQPVNLTSCNLNVALLLVALLPVLPSAMTADELRRYLSVSKSVAATRTVMSAEHLLALVRFSKTVLGPVDDCEDLLEFGCTYAAMGRTSDSSLSIDVEETHNCLRDLIRSNSSHNQDSVKPVVVKKRIKRRAKNAEIFKEKLRIRKANKAKLTLLKNEGKTREKKVKSTGIKHKKRLGPVGK